ncbi:MAG: PhnD/SsuA/transferrin family substrate-binding protein [Anaerolineales bacterium]|nr:PhnD/SsuA/transferrin family substrate-binding protein [Anaerolineales bacterium]
MPYALLVRQFPGTVEPLAAPVLRGERFAGQPIYFSDVIVRRDAPFTHLEDLRGQAWAYNEPSSHSGYNLTIVNLVRRGFGPGFFGRTVQSGAHQKSIQMVLAGEVEASAIDCQVLMVEMRARPELGEQLKIIESFGPSTIQPLAVATSVPETLRTNIRALLTELHHEPAAREYFEHGFIEKWVAVNDASYDDIRQMYVERERANFHTL